MKHATPAPNAPRPTVRVRCTLARGRPRTNGIRADAYYWGDLVDGHAPRKKERGSSAYVLYHGTEDGIDVQVSHTTTVRVDPGADAADPNDDILLVEERITVQRGALQELMDRERAWSDQVTLRWRTRLATRNARHRRAIGAWRTAWLQSVLLTLVQFEARLGNALIAGARKGMRSLVTIPDQILTRSMTASLHLRSRSGRRDLWVALIDPGKATSQEKSIVLLLATLSLVFFILIASNLIALGFTSIADQYQQVVGDFTASLLSVLALPIPVEPLLILSVLALGPILGVLGALLGKLVGSWMLYLLGDTLFDEIERKTATKPRLKRVTDWMQARANKSGFWLLAIINAVPLIPDVLVYVFAVSGMRYRSYFGGILLGTALKFGAIVAGVYWLGPDRVQLVLDHPIQAMLGR